MKDFVDFITGGFFNFIGAAWRKLFSKEKFSVLVKENLSYNIGMLILTILIFALFAVIKLTH